MKATCWYLRRWSRDIPLLNGRTSSSHVIDRSTNSTTILLTRVLYQQLPLWRVAWRQHLHMISTWAVTWYRPTVTCQILTNENDKLTSEANHMTLQSIAPGAFLLNFFVYSDVWKRSRDQFFDQSEGWDDGLGPVSIDTVCHVLILLLLALHYCRHQQTRN